MEAAQLKPRLRGTCGELWSIYSCWQLSHFYPWSVKFCSSKMWLDLPLEVGLEQGLGSVPAS